MLLVFVDPLKKKLAWRRRVHCLCLLYIPYKGLGPPRYLSFFRQLFKLEQKQYFDLLTRFGFHLHLLVDICHPFSVFLSVSGTLFRPLPYLRVAVFLPSDLFFTLSTKQRRFLTFSPELVPFFPSSCLFLTFPPSVFTRVFFFFLFFYLSLSFSLPFFPVVLFSCTLEESPPISPLLLDNPLKIYHNNNNNNNNNKNFLVANVIFIVPTHVHTSNSRHLVR